MRLGVVGTGYVGLVTGVCFAEMGNEVVCCDQDEAKISKLRAGFSPIFEPGLEKLITENVTAGRLQFSTSLSDLADSFDAVFIAVGTPSDASGAADLTAVYEVAKEIGQALRQPTCVVNKSTVPVGTQKQVKQIINNELKRRNMKFTVDVVSNPEFLREGSAIEDCLKPQRVVVGAESEQAFGLMKRLYAPFVKNGNPIHCMTPESSEMTKYAANAFLATKISLMNEFSRICEEVGADIEEVRRAMGSDVRIGPHFIYPGIGYGGSCFPKDVSALIHTARSKGIKSAILESVQQVNFEQRKLFIDKLLKTGLQTNEKVAVWGVAFKPGTDDVRDAPAVDLINTLLQAGFRVEAYDSTVAKHHPNLFSHPNFRFSRDQYECLSEAAALCIVTEWKSFREPNFIKMKSVMKRPVILDGRNLYDLQDLKRQGFYYRSVGRPTVEIE